MFDSTHFQGAGSVQVTINAWGINRTTGITTFNSAAAGPILVKNNLLTAQHPDPGFSDGSTAAASNLSIYVATQLTGSWTGPQFCAAVSDKNVVYYCGHGAQSLFSAGKVWTDPIDDMEIPTYVIPYGSDTFVAGHPSWQDRTSLEPYRMNQMGFVCITAWLPAVQLFR